MVVHSPPAERRVVPPSVAAAAAAAATAPSPGEANLLGDLAGDADRSLVEEFDTLAGANTGPAGIVVQADVHTGIEEKREPAVDVHRDVKTQSLTNATDDADRISVADSNQDFSRATDQGSTRATGQGSTRAADHPPLNPFTPEWFAQIINAAATTAATAAATAVASSSRPAAAPNAAAPRRLNERKVPDFWEDRPEFWFRIFDAHLAHFSPSEQGCFDTLLPLLTPAARATVHSVIRSPGTSPYSKAREALLRHFGRTPRQMAREMRDTRVLGDRLATEFLDHIVALLPDVRTLYEVALLDALPANARVAALQHTDVYAMARAADAVLLENRAEAEAPRTLEASVNSLTLLDGDLQHDSVQPLTPTVSAVSRGQRPPLKKTDTLCAIHARYGKEAFKCQSPSTCKMKNVLAPRPPPPPSSSASASGNGPAGGRK